MESNAASASPTWNRQSLSATARYGEFPEVPEVEELPPSTSNTNSNSTSNNSTSIRGGATNPLVTSNFVGSPTTDPSVRRRRIPSLAVPGQQQQQQQQQQQFLCQESPQFSLVRKSSIMSTISRDDSHSGSQPDTPRASAMSPQMMADARRSPSRLSRVPSFGEPSLSRKRSSTFRPTSLHNLSAAGKKDLSHRPIVSRDFPQAKVPGIGAFNGFLQIFRCDGTITIEKPPCSDTNEEIVHMRLMTEEEVASIRAAYTEDESTNTIVLAPALLIGFLFAIVIYCGIIVFWAPTTRLYETGGLPWRGGEMYPTEALLPMVLTLLYVVAITYANTLSISFSMFERQFMIEPEVLHSLQGREVSLNPDDLKELSDVNREARIPFIRRSIEKKVRWYVQDGRDSLPADLYANYLNSLASVASAKDYKTSVLTGVANVGLPFIVAIAPMTPRLFSGGSIWGSGLAEEFALAICGPALSGLCAYGIVAMLNLFAFTMRFHRYRLDWLTLALPDPTRPPESTWPQLGFDVLENVLVWHRLRSVMRKPPMALYLWGRRLCEVTLLIFVLLVVLSIVYNFVNPAPSVYDATTALTIALLLTLAPMLLFTMYAPLRCTFLRTEHVSVLCRILLLSLKDVGLERNVPGITDEALMKVQDIRSAIKQVARNIALEEEVQSFFGHPLSIYTMIGMLTFFTAAAGLVVMRIAYTSDRTTFV